MAWTPLKRWMDATDPQRDVTLASFAGVVAFEYEAEENDPLPGLTESVGYTKGVLAVI